MTFHGAGGEVDQLARGFETLDATLGSLCSALRDLNIQDSGPTEATQTFADALGQLERGLGRISAQANGAAAVVRRFEGEGGDA